MRAPLTLLALALALCLVAAPNALAAKKAARTGGKVEKAWPATKKGKPASPLARFLAEQVGGITPPKKAKLQAAHVASARGATAAAAAESSAAASGGLRLVRSYAIPTDDPSATRLANLSFTYDSAVAASAFALTKQKTQAEQLLDQLKALQRKDGSIEDSFNTLTGASTPLVRNGSVAWLGIAANDYKAVYKNDKYASVAEGVANWLMGQQQDDTGLVHGGPDVKWTSTQHNELAYSFLSQYAELYNGKTAGLAKEAAERMAAGIDKFLLVDDGSGLHFTQGLDDPVVALDAQTLGVFYLLARDRKDDAAQVMKRTLSTMQISNVSIVKSKDPATYNMTYASPGPFTGFRPYEQKDSPQVLWMEGTQEARMAMAATGFDTSVIDKSNKAWQEVSPGLGLLQSNGTVTQNAFNEYHVWPAAAPTSWALLNGTGTVNPVILNTK